MWRVQARWSSVGLGLSYTNLHFGDEAAAATAHGLMTSWLQAIAPRLHPSVSVTVQPEVREVAIATGETTDIVAVTPTTVTGTGSGNRVPDVCQVLYRLVTPNVLGGRRVKGRINVPGLDDNLTVQGGLTATAQNQFQSAIDTTLLSGTAPATLLVYSRPRMLEDVVIRPGFAFEVASASVWSELAVLRSRRT